MAQNTNLFEKNKEMLFNKHHLKLYFLFDKNYCFIRKYPQKSSIEDFYLTNVYTKNSKTMQDCSKKNRKFKSNFI
jgi:hypothetical protein